MITVDQNGVVSWSTHNVSETELLIFSAYSQPIAVVLPAQGSYQGPFRAERTLFTYQLYNHSSGWRGRLLAAAVATPWRGEGAPPELGATYVFDIESNLHWFATGVERAELWFEYAPSGFGEFKPWEELDCAVGARERTLGGIVMLEQQMGEAHVRLKIVGFIGAEEHLLGEWEFGPLADPGGAGRGFYGRIPRGARRTPRGTGWVRPRPGLEDCAPPEEEVP